MGALGVGAVLGGISDLFGGNNKTTASGTSSTNTTGVTNTSSNGATTSGTNPILSSLQTQLSGAAGANALNANKQATNLTGYTQAGLENINSTDSDQALKAQLQGSGMEYSPAGANAETSNQLNRINQGNQFLAGVPLLQTQLNQQALSGLNSTFSTLPTATSSTGTTANTAASSTEGSSNTAQNSQTNTISGILGALGF